MRPPHGSACHNPHVHCTSALHVIRPANEEVEAEQWWKHDGDQVYKALCLVSQHHIKVQTKGLSELKVHFPT